MAKSPSVINGHEVAEWVQRFRMTKPHVHCITNSVAQHFTANVLLAAGATPSMTIAAEEVGDFVRMADALLINLGTMDAQRTVAVNSAIAVATDENKAWVLDPVFVQASPIRLQLAQLLLQYGPTLIRCNETEYSALFGTAADPIISREGTLIALTGKQDRIVAEAGTCTVMNGSALMDRVTAMGCALTALMVGFLSLKEDELAAATAAVSFFGLAGEYAERASNGPGTFVPHFLDALANLDGKAIAEGVRLS